MSTSQKKWFYHLTFILVLIILTYLGLKRILIYHGYDKHTYIAMNLGFQSHFIDNFTTSYIDYAPSYRPFAKFYYQLQYWLFNCQPTYYFAMNLVGWMLAAYLIFYLSFIIYGNYFFAIWPGFFFITDIRITMMTWITSSHNLWATICGLLSLIFYFKFYHPLKEKISKETRIPIRYQAGLFFLLLSSILFKEFGIIFISFFIVEAFSSLFFTKNKLFFYSLIRVIISVLIIYFSMRYGLVHYHTTMAQFAEQENSSYFWNILNGASDILYGHPGGLNLLSYFRAICLIFSIIAMTLDFKRMLPWVAIIATNILLCFLQNRERNHIIGGMALYIMAIYGSFLLLNFIKKSKGHFQYQIYLGIFIALFTTRIVLGYYNINNYMKKVVLFGVVDPTQRDSNGVLMTAPEIIQCVEKSERYQRFTHPPQ